MSLLVSPSPPSVGFEKNMPMFAKCGFGAECAKNLWNVNEKICLLKCVISVAGLSRCLAMRLTKNINAA